MKTCRSDESGFPSPETWDEMVARSQHGHLLQSWTWGEFKSMFGWHAVRVALDRGGQLVAGAQLLFRKLPYRCLAYVPRGPWFGEAEASEVSDDLWGVVHTVARQYGAIALKVEPPWEEHCPADNLVCRGFEPSSSTIQPRRTIMIDLAPDEDAILAQMKSKARYNVRLSGRKDVVVYPGGDDDLAEFYRLMRITSERDGFAIHSAAYYRAAWEHFEPRGEGVLLMARYRGDVIAGLLAFGFGSTAAYFYGASSDEHRNRMPNHGLQWEAMIWAKTRGYQYYDLWGIPDLDPDSPTADLTGVQRFKEGFGGRIVRYVGAFDYVYSKPLFTVLNRAWSLRRRVAA